MSTANAGETLGVKGILKEGVELGVFFLLFFAEEKPCSVPRFPPHLFLVFPFENGIEEAAMIILP